MIDLEVAGRRAGVLRGRLDEASLVHLDARVVALHLLAAPRYAPLTRLVFAGLRVGSIRGQSSAVALYLLLAEVYRRGEPDKAAAVARILEVHGGLTLVPVDSEVAVQAAQVRAQLGGRPERAMQIATALVSGAEIYLTEGSGLRRIVGMSVINLEEYAARA